MKYSDWVGEQFEFDNQLQVWKRVDAGDPNLMEEYQKGKTCGECGKENDFSDDCGWFYGYVLETHYVPHCSTCWHSKGYRTGER